ncbi:MAG: hypothetical protein EPN84_06775 [Legionella sp.]|nr:MAG: hypothetical protein EPN84_06775 [Legionella sp.]
MNSTNSSLIIRLPNWVGDVVMALPTIKALREQGISLQLLGKPWINDLLAALDLPLFTLEKKFWATRNKIAQIPADKIVLLTNSFSSALSARLANKQVIGYSTDHRSFLLKQSLTPSASVHEVNYFWNIAAFACQYWFPEIYWPQHLPSTIHLPLCEKALTRVKELLAAQKIQQPFWVLCPFAQGTGINNQSKIWPFWSELSAALKDKMLLVCPGPQEESQAAHLVPHARALTGLNLAEYAALLSLAEQVIANDSGPMHMAAALNPHTLGLFGVSKPQRTQPWGGTYLGSDTQWPSLDTVLAQLKIFK